MADTHKNTKAHVSIRELPRNVWAVGYTSFFLNKTS